MPIINCIQCGVAFHRHPSKIKRAKINFCSHACQGAYTMSKRVAATCAHCGTAIDRCLSKITYYKMHFCSNTCQGAHTRSQRPSAACAYCGAAIDRVAFRIEHAKIHFCSHACRGAYERVGFIDAKGYRKFQINGKQFYEHRLIMESHLGRKLLPTEHIHHINGDKADNLLSNLVIVENVAHQHEHHPLTWDLERARAMRAEGLSFQKIGKALSIDHISVYQAFIRRGLHVPTSRNGRRQ